MKRMSVVIGANYGDEGKGQSVHELVTQSTFRSLVVRYSGGAQAGHTVVTSGLRHVFHHIGSGFFNDSPTWLSKEFIVNPVLFRDEYSELTRNHSMKPVVFIDPECRVSTPYDMLLNIIREEERGTDRHGSCGCGIFETIQRHKEIPLTWSTLTRLVDDEDAFNKYMTAIQEYSIDECQRLRGDTDRAFYDCIHDAFRRDVLNMKLVTSTQGSEILDQYDDVVFEGSQGLLLDEKYGTFPHLTPSSVGAEVPVKYADERAIAHPDTEIHVNLIYLTRPYMTRHGAGPMDFEVDSPDSLGVDHPTETNVYNEHQQNFRYGILDVTSYLDRIFVDSYNAIHLCSTTDNVNIRYSTSLTCESHMTGLIPVIMNNKRYNVSFETLEKYLELN